MWQPTCHEVGISHRHSPGKSSELKNVTLWLMIKGSLLLYISSQKTPKSSKLSPRFLNIMDWRCPAKHQEHILEPGLKVHVEIDFCDSKMTGGVFKWTLYSERWAANLLLWFQECLPRCSREALVPLPLSKRLWGCNHRIKKLALLLLFVLFSLFTDTLAQFT